MTQTTGRFFDEIGKLLTDAAGAADGVRKEVEGVVRTQAERVLSDLDVVQREEFEVVKAMAQRAREENELLKERIAALEAKSKTKSAAKLRAKKAS
ncbi:MAG: accessory factor UbiK family protein [Hyphomicrobiaceae bacterium]|jgi:BMFP domain-containing protein YqiC|nr:accessory factor UbiK family protein [Methyloceanibacter sp.]MDX2317691.1 accessory factor UbiK family protein [Hyphomicrobiaceae bacterium]MDX2449718.1 accessory factor UbiK family protein [Hyphomicrobiaceae bacterium]